MTPTIETPAHGRLTEISAITQALHGQELELSIEQADTGFELRVGTLYLRDAFLETKGSARGAMTLSFASCCDTDALLTHHLHTPGAISVERDDEGEIRFVTIRAQAQETLYLRVAKEAPSPGRRHLSFKPNPDACTHSNCPLRPAP